MTENWMNEGSKPQSRDDLLADVAEMYYREGKKQAEIAERIGLTR